MLLNRRDFLILGSALPVVGLSGCGPTPPNAIPDDLRLLISGLDGVVQQAFANPVIAAAISPTNQQFIIAGIAALKAILNGNSSLVLPDGKFDVPKIEQTVNTIIGIIAAVPGVTGTPIGVGLTAASILLPIVETALGRPPAAPAPAPLPPGAPLAAPAPLSPDNARVVLRGFSTTR